MLLEGIPLVGILDSTMVAKSVRAFSDDMGLFQSWDESKDFLRIPKDFLRISIGSL